MTELALTYTDPNTVTIQTATFAVPRLQLVSNIAPEANDWSIKVEQRLNYLTGLPAGWDGYKSQRVSPLTVRFVWDLLSSVMTKKTATPSIVPVTGGGLQVEWHRNGLDIELYVSKPMKTELFVSYADDRPDLELELASDFGVLSLALAELA